MIREAVFTDPAARARFLREMQGLGRVQSTKNIVRIFHVGQHLDQPYYVMPYLAGGTLYTNRKHYPRAKRSRSWRKSPAPSTNCTPSASCTATSSWATSSWTRRANPSWGISA